MEEGAVGGYGHGCKVQIEVSSTMLHVQEIF